MQTSEVSGPFRMGLEGIVSKRTHAAVPQRAVEDVDQSKNPASEAVRREREEKWRYTR